MNEGFDKDFYRKGKSVKRSGPFSEPPDSENGKVGVLIPFSSYIRPRKTKSDSKVTKSDFWGVTQKRPKSDFSTPKVTQKWLFGSKSHF